MIWKRKISFQILPSSILAALMRLIFLPSPIPFFVHLCHSLQYLPPASALQLSFFFFFTPNIPKFLPLISLPFIWPLLFCCAFWAMRSEQYIQCIPRAGVVWWFHDDITCSVNFKTLFYILSCLHFNICCAFLVPTSSCMFYSRADKIILTVSDQHELPHIGKIPIVFFLYLCTWSGIECVFWSSFSFWLLEMCALWRVCVLDYSLGLQIHCGAWVVVLKIQAEAVVSSQIIVECIYAAFV